MATSIQISEELMNYLHKMKVFSKESYEDLIWDLIEDRMELSENTKKNIADSEEDIRSGRIFDWDEIKKELALNV
jgi:predicted CopG family antitoxin